MLLVAIVVGAVAGYLLGRMRANAAPGAESGRVEELRAQLAEERKNSAGLREQRMAAESARSASAARAEEIAKKLEEEKALLGEAQQRLSDAFSALATKALSQNNQSFLTLAEQKFGQLKESAAADLDARRAAVEQLVNPIAEALNVYQRETQDLEKRRVSEMSSLGTQLAAMAEAQAGLQQETAKLVNALRSPQVRGRWGEI